MSSDYCSVSETSQKDTVLCPDCGEKGKPVSLATVGAMAKTEVDAVKLSAREYQLCRNRDCPVVYYAGAIQLEKRDLRVPVNFKERNYEGLVCYCFNYTVTDIRAEIQTKGHSTAQRMITQEVKAGRCACEVKNPGGTCCLGDITRAVQAVMAQVRDRRAALQTTGGKQCKNETPTPC
jgi:Zinc binding domain